MGQWFCSLWTRKQRFQSLQTLLFKWSSSKVSSYVDWPHRQLVARHCNYTFQQFFFIVFLKYLCQKKKCQKKREKSLSLWNFLPDKELCNNLNIKYKSLSLLASEVDNSPSLCSHMDAEAIYTTKPFDAITSLVVVYQPSVTSERLMIPMNQSMLLHLSNTRGAQWKKRFLLRAVGFFSFFVTFNNRVCEADGGKLAYNRSHY